MSRLAWWQTAAWAAFVAAIVMMTVFPLPGFPWVLAAPLGAYWATLWAIGRERRRRRAALRFPGYSGSFTGHDHTGPGPCSACLVTVAMLTGMVGAVFASFERLANTQDIWNAHHLAQVSRWLEEMDADVTADMAARSERAAAFKVELSAPLSDILPCRAMLGGHLCRERIRGTHAHKCSCGTVWGLV